MPLDTLTSSDYSPASAGHAPARATPEFPALDKEPGWLGRRLAALPGEGHPVLTYLLGLVISFVVIVALSTLAGLLVTRVLLRIHSVAGEDESFVRFLVRHRSPGLTDASLVGSIMAGGVVLPIIVGVAALLAVNGRHWRLAGFLALALGLESSSYGATALLIHRHRPEVHRLETLPVNASYPSGHTAAAIAVYCGIALLLTSRIANRWVQAAIWLVAGVIPVFVAFSRMYRGMHHPLDVAGGVIVGIAALSALVLVTRATGRAAR